MEYTRLMFILVGLSTCTRCVDGVIKGDFVEFNTTKPEYNVGDNVTLTCYVDNWLLVTFIRNDSDLGDCFAPPYHVCTETFDMRTVHTNYGFKLNKTCAWLEIKNVSKYDSGVDFACHWTSYREHVSFLVIDKPETQNTDIKDMPTTGGTGIVVGVVGAIIGLAGVVTALCYQRRHKPRNSSRENGHVGPYEASTTDSKQPMVTHQTDDSKNTKLTSILENEQSIGKAVKREEWT